jgi:hypothetical protein
VHCLSTPPVYISYIGYSYLTGIVKGPNEPSIWVLLSEGLNSLHLMKSRLINNLKMDEESKVPQVKIIPQEYLVDRIFPFPKSLKEIEMESQG